MKIVERPRCVRLKRRWACRLVSECTGNSMLRRTSPGSRTFWWSPVTKSHASTVLTVPSVAHSVNEASSATARVIIGPAGSDIQMLPPTVAEFHTLKEERKYSQLTRISGLARQLSGGTNAYSSATVPRGPDTEMSRADLQ